MPCRLDDVADGVDEHVRAVQRVPDGRIVANPGWQGPCCRDPAWRTDATWANALPPVLVGGYITAALAAAGCTPAVVEVVSTIVRCNKLARLLQGVRFRSNPRIRRGSLAYARQQAPRASLPYGLQCL